MLARWRRWRANRRTLKFLKANETEITSNVREIMAEDRTLPTWQDMIPVNRMEKPECSGE